MTGSKAAGPSFRNRDLKYNVCPISFFGCLAIAEKATNTPRLCLRDLTLSNRDHVSIWRCCAPECTPYSVCVSPPRLLPFPEDMIPEDHLSESARLTHPKSGICN